MAKFGKASKVVKPDGEVRQSQLVTTFGPGSMMDLLDQAVLVGGLDVWKYDKRVDPSIQEPRLRDALVERFREAGQELSYEAFRKPPVPSDDRAPGDVGVPVLEFPGWFVCQNPSCRSLVRHDHLDAKGHRYEHRCVGSKKPAPTVPVRFLGACKRGHAEEFPWIWFAHVVQGSKRCSAPQLTLVEDAMGDFSGIRVVCACGASARLSTAYGGGLNAHPCDGKRPWLGPDAKEDCTEPLRLLVRTASNSYFAQVVSALSVPEPGKEIEEAVQAHWETLKVATAELLPAFLAIPKIQAAVGKYKLADVLAAIARLHKGTGAARLPLRTAEYKQLTSAPQETAGDRVPPRDTNFFARELKLSALPRGLARVVVVPKLREVRAQIGFTRFEPVSADLQGEFDLRVESARLGLTTDWLPATEVWGEGVFIELDEAAVHAWEKQPDVIARTTELQAGYEAWIAAQRDDRTRPQQDDAPKKRPTKAPFPGARFYLLHSLSHLLITAISLECGYSASAIRERIYCGPSAADATPMAAILLSTGSAGSEGTLGGLVEQGRRIREHLQRAYENGRLCSNDPVCATHTPEDDRAERYLEGAACHGCLFISEPSCERFNRYLDRALVVPTLGHAAALAFFRESP
jgi:hypothetical protein